MVTKAVSAVHAVATTTDVIVFGLSFYSYAVVATAAVSANLQIFLRNIPDSESAAVTPPQFECIPFPIISHNSQRIFPCMS